MKINNYEDALNFIHQRPRFQKEPTLDRLRFLLQKLGDPQKGQHYIHVTGTNGKGSVVAMLRQMFIEQGLNVGTFTSPFITRFNERIAINGQPISDADLVKYTKKVATIVQTIDEKDPSNSPTEFEIDTAIMFLYFAAHQLDVVILEVGIGGRYDSTNIIENPVVTSIVTVGYDHMRLLGDTLAKIAWQKAGIIKHQSPVVIGKIPAEAEKVILDQAKVKHSSVFDFGESFSAHVKSRHNLHLTINYSGLDISNANFKLSLAGDYQLYNAAVAITIFQLFMKQRGLAFQIVDIRQALANTSWPARMEIINDSPTIILDGAHNLPGIQALSQTIKQDLGNTHVYILLAVLADKQYDLMLGELASLPNVEITLTTFAGPYKGRQSADFEEVLRSIHSKYRIKINDNWQLAIGQIAHNMSEDDVLIVTGSLYFVSDVRHFMLD